MTEQKTVTTQGERIQLLIKRLGINGLKFSKEIGVSQSLVSSTIKGLRVMSINFVIKTTTRYPDVREAWLWTGEGEMMKSDESKKRYLIQDEAGARDAETPYSKEGVLENLRRRVEALEAWRSQMESSST